MLLTVKQIATRLHVRPSAVRELIRKGALPALRPGGRRLLVLESDFAAWLEGSRVRPTPARPPKAVPDVIIPSRCAGADIPQGEPAALAINISREGT